MPVARDVIAAYPFEERIGGTIIRREPIGLCALFAPWNWPIQTAVIKLIHAIAAGVPPGVFNLIIWRGSVVGYAMSRHSGVVMDSFTVEQAVEMVNNSIFGLGAYVFTRDRKAGYEVASQLQAGRVCFNGANTNSLTPMGGYKQSGIGRSMGVFGLEEYLEVKSVYGFDVEAASLPEHV